MLLRRCRPRHFQLRHLRRVAVEDTNCLGAPLALSSLSTTKGLQARNLTFKTHHRSQWAQQVGTHALVHRSSDVQPESADFAVQQLQAAFHWEARHQYTNAQGKQQAFAVFAAVQFLHVQQQLFTPLQKSACQKLLTGFQAYERLTRYQRADLVQSASNCLSAWMANPSLVNGQPSTPPPSAQMQALAPVSVAEQQQLDDRRSSSMTASTSQAASIPAAFSTAAAAASTCTGSTVRQFSHVQLAHGNAPPESDSLLEFLLNSVSKQAPAEDTSAGMPAEQVSKQAVSTAGVPLPQLLADPLKVLGEEPDPIATQHASPSTAESLLPDTSPPDASDSSLHDQHPDKVGTTHPTKHAELENVPQNLDLSLAARPDDPSHDQSPSSQGAGMKGKRPELLAFETSFAQAAAAAEAADTKVNVGAGGQLSAEWHALRQGRLTASTFANALGMFSGGRQALWEEKLGLAPKFAGNAATQWGTRQEADALLRYGEITGHSIDMCSFKMVRDDEVHGWLGASPDGLVQSLGLEASQGGAVLGMGSGVIAGEGPGVLEIKCPFNKGDPNRAAPPKMAQWYYMPQVQGLMDIFDREWCNLFVWTVNGSSVFHIKRDREYWCVCFQALAEFWWSHVVPAKHALAGSQPDLAHVFRPDKEHATTAQIIALSKQMARDAPSTSFAPTKQRVQLAQRRKAPISM
ncbi:hypothetical protein WJX77_001122 [Trebouxia sp. C0004]